MQEETEQSPLPEKATEAKQPIEQLPPEQPQIVPETSADFLIEQKQQDPALPDKEKKVADALHGLRNKLRRHKAKPNSIPQVRDAMTRNIEQIMEEGLGEAYTELSTIEREQFKIKGEATAFKIRDLLRGATVKVKKIFRLLLEWLKIMPGVNRYYLEQEAKIKAEKIAALKQVETGIAIKE